MSVSDKKCVPIIESIEINFIKFLSTEVMSFVLAPLVLNFSVNYLCIKSFAGNEV